jgi:hypothetical protein
MRASIESRTTINGHEVTVVRLASSHYVVVAENLPRRAVTIVIDENARVLPTQSVERWVMTEVATSQKLGSFETYAEAVSYAHGHFARTIF